MPTELRPEVREEISDLIISESSALRLVELGARLEREAAVQQLYALAMAQAGGSLARNAFLVAAKIVGEMDPNSVLYGEARSNG